jgi:hypothetical protein
MNRWAAAVGSAVFAAVLSLALTGLLVFSLSGCDETCGPTPAWQLAIVAGVPALAAVVAARWGWRRAQRSARPPDVWR